MGLTRDLPTKDAILYEKIRTCQIKRRYADEVEASVGLVKTQKVYQCPYCNGWHRATISLAKAIKEVKASRKKPTKTPSKKSDILASAKQHYPDIKVTNDVLEHFRKQIRTPTFPTRFVSRLSHTTSIFRVDHSGRDIYVAYSKKHRAIKRFVPQPTISTVPALVKSSALEIYNLTVTDEILAEMAAPIARGDQAFFVKRLSNKKTIWRLPYGEFDYLAVYSTKSHAIERFIHPDEVPLEDAHQAVPAFMTEFDTGS